MDIYLARLTELDAGGFLRVQVDSFGDDGTDPIEVLAPGGTLFRPRDPAADSSGNISAGCPTLVLSDGGKRIAIPCLDTRAATKLPVPLRGGFVTFGDTGKGQLPNTIFDGDTGSWTLYVPYDFAGDVPGKAHVISVNVDNQGAEVIQIIHGSGANVQLMADGSITLTAKNKEASLTVAAGGKVTINANLTVQGGVICGDPTLAQPVANATLLLTYLTGLEAALAGFAAALVPKAGAMVLASDATAASAALTAALAALQAAKALVPTTLTKAL